MSLPIDVANGVVTDINSGSYSGFDDLLAVRHYLPKFKLPEMSSLKVVVVPVSKVSVPATRVTRANTIEIDVGIMKRLAKPYESTDGTTELDSLMNLVQAIEDRLWTTLEGRLTTMISARLQSANPDPLYDQEHLREMGQFTSVNRLVYQVNP